MPASIRRPSTPALIKYEQAGYQIGTGVGVFALLVLWAMGAIILGPMMFFTRGNES